MSHREYALLLACALVGCGCSCGSDAPVSDSGPADAPATDAPMTRPFDPVMRNCPGGVEPASCDAGHRWMDCGGTGEPLMACNDTGCAWFRGGCVRAAWEPSVCAVGDPFCVTTEDGSWPFASDWFPDGLGSNDSVCHDLDMIGDAVITPTSNLNIDVAIDPSVEAPSEVTVACDSVSLWMCRVASEVLLTVRGGVLTFDKGSGPPLLTERVIVEVLRVDGEPKARALAYYADDTGSTKRSCTRWPDRPRFDGGELVIDDPSAEMPHGTLRLDEVSGGSVAFRF